MIDVLEKGGEDSILESVIALLHQEQKAVLKQFDWWEDSDWDMLELQDNDYNLIAIFPDRLELPLRQTIVGVKKAKGEGEKSGGKAPTTPPTLEMSSITVARKDNQGSFK